MGDDNSNQSLAEAADAIARALEVRNRLSVEANSSYARWLESQDRYLVLSEESLKLQVQQIQQETERARRERVFQRRLVVLLAIVFAIAMLAALLSSIFDDKKGRDSQKPPNTTPKSSAVFKKETSDFSSVFSVCSVVIPIRKIPPHS